MHTHVYILCADLCVHTLWVFVCCDSVKQTIFRNFENSVSL